MNELSYEHDSRAVFLFFFLPYARCKLSLALVVSFDMFSHIFAARMSTNAAIGRLIERKVDPGG